MFSWESCTEVLRLKSPINTLQSNRGADLRSSSLEFSLDPLFFPNFLVLFHFFIYLEKKIVEEAKELCNWSVTSNKIRFFILFTLLAFKFNLVFSLL